MTATAITSGWDMRTCFPSSGRTIVAGSARTCDLRVINSCRWFPHRSHMAALAEIAGQNVGNILAGGRRAIVTT